MTRSKPESPSSQETGDAPDAPDLDRKTQPKAQEPHEAEPPKTGPVEIELEVSRQRHVSWAIFGTLVGALLIWKLGTVGRWGGVVLILLGIYHAYQLVQTFLHAPGTIVVSDREVWLPRGLCMSKPIKVEPSAVTAAYFLRRSVPWNRSAPVLVVEVGDMAIAFPRDWFASEADQRHVISALLAKRKSAA